MTFNWSDIREECKMRHENGNCLPCGGFCTSINNEICEALHNAFNRGYVYSKLENIKNKKTDMQ